MVEMRSTNKILVGKPKVERPLGTPRLRRQDDIKMKLKHIGYEYTDWIHLHQDRM
jgi:hypothetical protein